MYFYLMILNPNVNLDKRPHCAACKKEESAVTMVQVAKLKMDSDGKKVTDSIVTDENKRYVTICPTCLARFHSGEGIVIEE